MASAVSQAKTGSFLEGVGASCLGPRRLVVLSMDYYAPRDVNYMQTTCGGRAANGALLRFVVSHVSKSRYVAPGDDAYWDTKICCISNVLEWDGD